MSSQTIEAPGRTSAPVSETVLIETVREGWSPRLSGIDEDHARLLAEAPGELPPIVVHRPTMRVVDGAHRLRAARIAGCSTIEVTWFDGSEAEASILAVESNVRHGLPLTLADRKEAARRILRTRPEWSDRSIAARTGLSDKTVGALRRRAEADGPEEAGDAPASRVGRDGRVRALDAVERRLKCREVLAELGEGASLRQVAEAAGVSVETARDVRDKLRRGEGPLPPRLAGTPTQRTRPSGPSRPRGRGPRQPAPPRGKRPVDLFALLDSLRKDPALRYSREGRTVIRWLETRVLREEEVRIAQQAPAHRATQIAAVARACAVSWNAIATELETRGV
ncbi:ParB/RepB/Spo0J family partition protein [Nocardiopsis halophila]|uniref:ParB/RepB/Spo0J family partition protein n=1 Tax=Nocardiopsis halophila TaxID=141692 RepID=UPI00036E4828|nr:ParB N-terminal domain-containing protein [Nocardiopsis halophila]